MTSSFSPPPQDPLPAQNSPEPNQWLVDLRHHIMNLLLGMAIAIGAVALVYIIVSAAMGLRDAAILPYYIGAYGLGLVLLFYRRIPDQWRALIFISGLFGFACFSLYDGWLVGSGRVFLIAVIAAATTLIGPKAGLVTAGLSLLTYAAFGLAIHQGWITPQSPGLSSDLTIIEGFGFVVAIGLATINLWFTRHALLTALQASHQAQKNRVLLEQRALELDAANHLLIQGSLSAEQARQEAEAARQTSEQQAWLLLGQAQLSAAIRTDPNPGQEQSLGSLAQRVLKTLAEYLHAHVGAMYAWDGSTFNWVGGYAQARPLVHSFKAGEGLAGQVARTASESASRPRILYLADLPPDYLKLASGLGEAQSQQVMIAPLVYHGQVEGILELGTLKGFAPLSQEFLEKNAESIAIALHSVKSRLQVVELLAETQRQAEELQAQAENLASQEEELRAANEELRAANEELQAQADLQANRPSRTRMP